MNICKNNCSHDSNKLVELLETVKSLYERIASDICQYAKELEKFQDYYQRFNLNSDVMYEVMHTKLDKLLVLFYTAVHNHLSITTNVKGIGDKIIKPVRQDYGTSTTVKYQNICRTCNKCNNSQGINSVRFSGNRDKLKVQSTINIATYDNVSIDKVTENNSFIGYLFTIGKLSYMVNNYRGLGSIKHVVNILDTNMNDNVYEVIQKETLTAESIELLYEFIDNQIKTLGDIETILVTNIEYVDKYIKKFKTNVC